MSERVHVIRIGAPSRESPCLEDDVYECNEVAPFDDETCPEPVVVHSETRQDDDGAWVCIHCGERTSVEVDA